MGERLESARGEAQRVFQDYLGALRQGQAITLDELIPSCPPAARDELRALLNDFEELRDALNEQPRGLVEGAVVGDFRLIRQLGEGAVGIVWEAEQLSLKRPVALKFLHPHYSLAPTSLQRFRREAEAGGRAQHPGIVSIFSIGETEGHHYIAQELVSDGQTLADRIAEAREAAELPASYYVKTVEIIRAVAAALQAAHDAGIIHRDLKPSNILLDEKEEPKIGDFGLAKLHDELSLSRSGDLTGTPFYMSPEQAASKRMGIDHRTDVFSLGATLYECLTLARPFAGDTSQQVLRKVLVDEPPDPCKLRSRLPADLAVICLKALEKNPDRRYQTARDLAEDLRRWSANEPIAARPPSSLRKVTKWVGRRPGWSAAIGLAALGLLTSITLSVRMVDAKSRAVESALEAGQRAEEARRQREAADLVASFLVEHIDTQIPRMAGTTVTATELLDNAKLRVEAELGTHPLVQARLMFALGIAYSRVGEYDKAEPLLLRSFEVRRERLGERDLDTLRSMSNLGAVYSAQGRNAEAEPLARTCLELRREILGAGDPETLESMGDLGNAYFETRRFGEAERLYREYVETGRETLGEDAPELLLPLTNLGLVHRASGRFEEAERALRDCYERAVRIRGDGHPDTVQALAWLAWALRDLGRLEEAELTSRQSLEGAQRHGGGPLHPRTLDTEVLLAMVRADQGHLDEAERLLLTNIDQRASALGRDHLGMVRAMNALAEVYEDSGRGREMEATALEALALATSVLGEEHTETLRARNASARALVGLGRYADAEELLIESLERCRAELGEDDGLTLDVLSDLGGFHFDHGRYSKAEPFYLECLEGRRRVFGDRHPGTVAVLSALAALYWNRNSLAEAEPFLTELLETRRAVLGEGHADTLTSLSSLGKLYTRQDRHAEAEPLLVECLEKRRAVLGEEHRTTLDSRRDLGWNYASWLHEQREELGSNAPSTLAVLNKLVSFHESEGNHGAAEALYLEWLDLLGAEDAGKPALLAGLAALYDRQSRWEDAQPLVHELLELTPEDSEHYAERKQLLDRIVKAPVDPLKVQGKTMVGEIQRYRDESGEYPTSLEEAGIDAPPAVVGVWEYHRGSDGAAFELSGGDYSFGWELWYDSQSGQWSVER